ncbi:MAG: hypothetical protein GF341_05040 [candidate division Zixibacteria bacterium]|nr:hypothetical protein [candidate division Zixibacteria bacterium]
MVFWRLLVVVMAVVCLAAAAHAQQSTTGPTRPEGVDLGLPGDLKTAPTIISGVPAYQWHHGCGPTAVGMVIGYYDQFLSTLVPGSAVSQTAAVEAMIACDDGSAVCGGPATNHYQDYACPIDGWPDPLEPDRSETGGTHPDNCVGDFMRTSRSSYGNYYGWSWYSDVGHSFTDYVAYVNPHLIASATELMYSEFTWYDYCDEIDANRPVVLLVDSDGNGNTDHFVTGVGYVDEGDIFKYIIYDTWDHSLHYYVWQQLGPGAPWGIYGVTVFDVTAPVDPVIAVTPTTYDFPTTTVGECSDLEIEFLVRNMGGGLLTGAISCPSPFEITGGNDTYADLAHGESASIMVRFCPTVPGPASSAIVFSGGGGTIVPVTGFAEPACECPYQCDFDANGVLDAVDLNEEINALFFNGPNPQDPMCPTTRADFNNDTFPDATDLDGLIDHLFFNGPLPVDPCAP